MSDRAVYRSRPAAASSATPDPRITVLRGAARALAEELGFEAAELLMHHFGGMQITVPLRPRKGSPLLVLLGRDIATVLSRLYGGGQIEVPVALGRRMEAAARMKAIQEHPGSHNQVAREFRCTRRWVRMVRRAGKSIGPLFGHLDS